jgi:two-component system NarL family response regulator
MFRRHHPDVVLMDLRLKSGNGIEATRAILREDARARIVALSMYQSLEAVSEALHAGAVTYLSKNSPSQDLLRVIREVNAGKRPIDPALQARLADRHTQPLLTPREVEVMELVAQGMRNKEIAVSLGIREETV